MNLWMRVVPVLLALVWMLSACPNPTPTACKEDKDCSADQVCQGEKCIAKGSAEEVTGDGGTEGPPPIPCKDDLECPEDKRCVSGACGAYPASCATDADCGLGRSCTAAKTCAITTCTVDGQCSPTTVCNLNTGRCEGAAPCNDTGDECGEGKVCDSCRKTCTTKPAGALCNEDFNCDIDREYCDQCVRACKNRLTDCQPCITSRECGDDNDLCLPAADGKKYCARACRSGRCAPGYKCTEGLDHPDKPGTKVSLCQPASGNCASPGECASNADCSGDQICDLTSRTCIAGCKADAECGSNRKCCRGRCVAPCTASSQCQSQETCKDGCCKLDGECQTSAECPEKQYCNTQTGLCTPGCQLAEDCGLPDPQRARCRFLCENNQCTEDCRCKDPNLDCGPIRFCPRNDNDPSQIVECRKPDGPICQRCQDDVDCACKPGDDCLIPCARKACQADGDCAQMPNGATTCYNQRCATKQVCAQDSDCPKGERCENNFCGEACNNRCIQLQSGNRCFTACNPKGDGKECPGRVSCVEMLPQEAQGPPCKFNGERCQTDADCGTEHPVCGNDGYCNTCPVGQICRGFNQLDPNDRVCIDDPPTMCADFTGALCEAGGF